MAEAGVNGLQDLRRTLRRLDQKDLDKQVQQRLKAIAEPVAAEARRRAPRGRGAIPTGRRPRKRMADTVVAFTRGAVAGVRVRVQAPDGYQYARRIEYDASIGEPFLRPALEAKEGVVRREAEDMLDWIASEWGTR